MKRLSGLQARVLEVLAGMEPPWTLTGGGALAGVHLGHRTTRDLDLFWHGQTSIRASSLEAVARLKSAGMSVTLLRTMEAFSALRVELGGEVVIVDMVAEPVAAIEPPRSVQHGSATFLVDTPHEILVNKLCALLHRSELRDLVDVEALLEDGGDLDRALADAPAKDGGFSALTLGFALRTWPVAAAARAAGLAESAARLERFRDELLKRSTGERP